MAFFPVTDLERWAQTTQTPGIKDAYIPEVCAKDLGLKDKSPIHGACAINAPTLLIHGEQDTRVPMDQSLEMAKTMLDYGKKPPSRKNPAVCLKGARPFYESSNATGGQLEDLVR